MQPYAINGKTITINGTAGDDKIEVMDDGILINGKKEALDMTRFTTVVVNGGAGNDEIKTRSAANAKQHIRINGGAGDDKLYAYNQDLLSLEARGGAGNDTLDVRWASAKSVKLFGQAGNNTIYGTGGKDTIFAGAGNDVVHGGAEHDVINGQKGNDTLYGGSGDDSLVGGIGDDTLYGDTGTDLLNGSAGKDTLFGGSGPDTLDGGPGVDQLNGGSDANTYRSTKGDTVDDSDALDNNHPDPSVSADGSGSLAGGDHWTKVYYATNPYYQPVTTNGNVTYTFTPYASSYGPYAPYANSYATSQWNGSSNYNTPLARDVWCSFSNPYTPRWYA